MEKGIKNKSMNTLLLSKSEYIKTKGKRTINNEDFNSPVLSPKGIIKSKRINRSATYLGIVLFLNSIMTKEIESPVRNNEKFREYLECNTNIIINTLAITPRIV